MRGSAIDKIRKGLGLTHQEFARLLGIALSTSYRWVKTRGELRVDPIHLKILTYIEAEVLNWADPRKTKMLARIKRALDAAPHRASRIHTDGTLRALAALLSYLTPSD
jgi:transcriptional regulator with XRE-family HTH domain